MAVEDLADYLMAEAGMTKAQRKTARALPACWIEWIWFRPTAAGWWRLKARNGEILAVSETYTRKTDTRRAARRAGELLGLTVKEVRK